MVRISSARINLEGGRLDNAMLKDYAETLIGGASGTNAGSAYTVDLSTGNAFYLILNANCTFTFSNPLASGKFCGFTLLLKQDGTGGHAITWPFTVAWSGDIPPTPNTTSNTWSIYGFLTVNGGRTWIGHFVSDSYT